MNLLEASVYVHLDRYVALNLGEQALYLPWNDIRARAIAHYHGERIVVGMRAEALTPVAPDTPGDVLQGRIRYLEHHGHESLAFLDIGATAIVVDELGGAVARAGAERRALRRFGGALQRLTGAVERRRSAARDARDPEQTSVLSDPGRHHRRPAELAVRLAPYPAVSPGHPLAVAYAWTPCTSSTNAATGSTSAGARPARLRHSAETMAWVVDTVAIVGGASVRRRIDVNAEGRGDRGERIRIAGDRTDPARPAGHLAAGGRGPGPVQAHRADAGQLGRRPRRATVRCSARSTAS